MNEKYFEHIININESKRTIAILKPSPGSPNKLSFGILQSSKIKLHVEEAFIPNLSSFFPKLSPGVGIGTKKALIPWKVEN